MKNDIKYEAPEALIVAIDIADVITTSAVLVDDILPDAWVGVQ